MGIQFNEIPYAWQVPGTYLEVRPARNTVGLFSYPTRVLLIGQSYPITNVGDPTRIYNITSALQAAILFGAGSMTHRMVLKHLLANPYLPVDVISVADATGAVAATWKIGLTGSWSVAGVLPISIGGEVVRVPVGATDTLSTLLSNAASLINTNINLSVTAAVGSGADAGKLILTAKNAGSEGNALDVAVYTDTTDVPPPGLNVTVTAVGGGTLNPDISAVINLISGMWYTDIVCPWTDSTNLAALAAELDARYNAMAKLDVHAYVGRSGTYGQLMTWKSGLNSRFRTAIVGTNLPSPPWECAASLAGVCARYLTDDPARQLRSRILPGIVGPRPKDRFLLAQRELLLENGMSTFGISTEGNVVLERVVTENLTNSLGGVDPSYHDIMAPKVASRIRYDWRTYMNLTYPTGKLAPDGSLAAENDPSVATPKKLQGSWMARMIAYEKQGWVQNGVAMAQLSRFEIDPNDKNRCNAYQPFDRIGNLMVLAGVLEFS